MLEKEIQVKMKKGTSVDKVDENYNTLKRLIEKNMEAFELKELIDVGGESYVYKSLIKKIKKPVVMKVIYNKEKHENNLKEIKIANKLKNQNIINFIGMKRIKQENYDIDCLILEYSKLGNLRHFQKHCLKKLYLSESMLCYFSYQILMGLRYCHMNKVAHYDIKPQNIIIDNHLDLKIIDFSISIDYKNLRNKIKLPNQGTNHYMAPEVLNSEVINVKDLEKIDLYSLGVLLYSFSNNSYPYESSNESTTSKSDKDEKINVLELKNNSNYSKYFFDFLQKLLNRDINQRINIKQALDHYWIKGAQILLEEKEKLSNANIFLSYLLYNYFINFNNYICI